MVLLLTVSLKEYWSEREVEKARATHPQYIMAIMTSEGDPLRLPLLN